MLSVNLITISLPRLGPIRPDDFMAVEHKNVYVSYLEMFNRVDIIAKSNMNRIWMTKFFTTKVFSLCKNIKVYFELRISITYSHPIIIRSCFSYCETRLIRDENRNFCTDCTCKYTVPVQIQERTAVRAWSPVQVTSTLFCSSAPSSGMPFIKKKGKTLDKWKNLCSS